ncbi:hypothetical protein [uncultured Methanobacterium sp.]|uniref:hypothetical protein n=1 Tax=uncultured Methanobacterium sp. TaxID=176306 RepID=UPI002AA8AD09|nr:hypothetical protein [uncultured Methanobacterium sp.]
MHTYDFGFNCLLPEERVNLKRDDLKKSVLGPDQSTILDQINPLIWTIIVLKEKSIQ